MSDARELAAQIAAATAPTAPQPTVSQAVIVSWQSTAVPPTVTVTLSGDTTHIPGISYASWYTPVAGDVVQVVKQDGKVLVVGPVTATLAQPVITGISPAVGALAGGTAITITGTALTGATGVKVNGVAATSVSVVSDGKLTCTTPAGTAGRQPVVVTTSVGSSNSATFTYPATAISSSTSFGQAAAAGTSTVHANSDHVHGTPATATTVTSSTSFGQSASAGTAATAAKGDHVHGTPADPTGNLFQGLGAANNLVSGGSAVGGNSPFLYTAAAVITVGAGSSWSFTSSGATIHGCGQFHVTPGDNTSGLGFLSVVLNNCSVSGSNLTLAGAAFTSGAVGIGSGNSIRICVSAMVW